LFEGLVVLFQGFFLGVVIAAPVGPIGLLCIRRTLEHGPAVGLATGMGAAVADTIFGAMAAFGISTAVTFLSGHELMFRLIGGVFMLAIAIRLFRDPPVPADNESEAANPPTSLGGFVTGLTLTLTNPITLFAFLALLAGIGLGSNLGEFNALTLVVGVFCGSASWWLTLCSGVALVRHRISEDRLMLINRGTAVALVLFGAWAVMSSVGAAWSFVAMVATYPS